jgi:outer membrane immunogenic protein
MLKLKWILLLSGILLVSNVVTAQDAANQTQNQSAVSDADFDSLGGNQIIIERARALQPQAELKIVQERTVNRRHRFELSPEFSGTFGGDTYNRTRSVGLNLNYHIVPTWSVGLKYNYAFNDLTNEGRDMARRANEDYEKNPSAPDAAYPEINYPKSETMALVNWYPVYGKMSWLEKKVTQFDFYMIGGYGTISLRSGDTSTYTMGLGLGLWLSQSISSRLEIRHQKYQAKYSDGTKDMDLAVASAQIGWLL